MTTNVEPHNGAADGTTDDGGTDEGQGTSRRSWRPRLFRSLVLLTVIVLAGGAAVLGKTYFDDRAVAQVRSDVPDIASERVVAMLGYDFATVDTELPKAYDGLTDSFRDDYATLVTEAIIPGAQEKQLVVRVSVQGSAVVSVSKDHTVVLLFVNQVTTGVDTPEAVTTGSRILASMDRVDGRWLMSGLEPI